jgi:hypothetical protein
MKNYLPFVNSATRPICADSNVERINGNIEPTTLVSLVVLLKNETPS